MKIHRICLGVLCALLLGTATGYSKQKIVIYVIPNTASQTIDVFAKDGDTVEWMTWDPSDSFTIQFYGAPLCKSSDKNKLHASGSHPATCKFRLPKGYPPGMLFNLAYVIVRGGQTPGPGKGPVSQPGGPFSQHVGSCDNCSPLGTPMNAPVGQGPAPVVAANSSTTYPEALSCSSPYVTDDPVNVSAANKDQIYWYFEDRTWTITFDDASVCAGPFTQNNSTCTVAGPSGSSPTVYHVVIDPKPGHPTTGCKFDAHVNAK